MIPIRDDAPRYTTPYINFFLLALNIFVFLFAITTDLNAINSVFGMRPLQVTEFLHGTRGATATTAFVPVLTSMFLHGGWLHLIFNMWGLYIFGDNIEDYLGHFRYLLFYLLTGLGAAFLHIVMNPNSNVPSVGASGAIAGVMGAYFILYPSARVLTLVPFFFVFFVWLPAWVVLGFWFVGQFLSGAASSIVQASQRGGGGIAFWAHVGGFVSGIALIKLFPTRPRRYRYFYR
ncbi:MAG TPA: rhomboid family intramembrane serine protease [Terriglobales bacterium]|nr:rhomboid family intramembrane serine protease [Terriglobales bacterium]